MNMMEMFLALMAVVLFTTLSLTYNQAIWRQTDYINNATMVVQASQICHAFLDEIDAKLFSGQLDIDDLVDSYNFTTTKTYPHLPVIFNVASVAADCDSLGQDLATPNPNSLFKRVRITVSGPGYLKQPYSMTRLFTRTFM
ncbi:MAG: hypothetical protein RBQ68_08605 [Candidatus Cloacimonadaceae bacterium]|jgi:hypothetical protein|nr:hypothetical protein [Candidatus Cloacimonadaceae bacterium]